MDPEKGSPIDTAMEIRLDRYLAPVLGPIPTPPSPLGGGGGRLVPWKERKLETIWTPRIDIGIDPQWLGDGLIRPPSPLPPPASAPGSIRCPGKFCATVRPIFNLMFLLHDPPLFIDLDGSVWILMLAPLRAHPLVASRRF